MKAHEMSPCWMIVWKRKNGNAIAYAGRHRIVMYDGWYKEAKPKELKEVLTHEMIHAFLSQNGVRDCHGPYFKTCCYLLGLDEAYAHERAYKWIGRCSECGHRYRKQYSAFSAQYCPECKKVTKTKNRRSKAKLKVRKECPSTQVDVSIIDAGTMASIPQTESTIAPSISMRSTDR